MNVNPRTRLILSALVIAALMLLSQSAQAGQQVSAGNSLWMRTSLPAPSDFESMTFFWRPSSEAGVTFQYVVYRPAGKYGQLLHPLGMDLDPFKGDSVIVEFRILEGSVEFLDPVWVWDGWVDGGKLEWVPYTFFFGFYLGRYPHASVVDYVPGEILEGEPPHGDPIVVYPMGSMLGRRNIRSDFVEAMEVSLDIKPLSCPNPVNTASRGNTPVALLGTADLDVRTVNLATIRLEGVAPVRSAVREGPLPRAALRHT